MILAARYRQSIVIFPLLPMALKISSSLPFVRELKSNSSEQLNVVASELANYTHRPDQNGSGSVGAYEYRGDSRSD